MRKECQGCPQQDEPVCCHSTTKRLSQSYNFFNLPKTAEEAKARYDDKAFSDEVYRLSGLGALVVGDMPCI